MKLQIGCGSEIKEGWINHDVADLPGVDIVHDLNEFPWPWKDQQFDEIYMKDVLEHLPNTIQTLEEIHRISKQEAKIYITVPYWNSWEAVTDPTHVKQFNEFSFNFFDPDHSSCKSRHYYSTARFKIKQLDFVIAPFRPHVNIKYFPSSITLRNRFLKKVAAILASYFSNIIIGLNFYLEKA